MGVQLYRPGKGFTMRGIECEMKVFDPYLFEGNLDAGWYLTPEEVPDGAPVVDLTETKEVEDNAEEHDMPEQGQSTALTDDEIRELAKEEGIKSWHLKSIETLLEELNLEG